MLKIANRTINGKRYDIVALAAEPGRRMLIKLFKLIGPTLSQALRGKSSLKELRIVDLSGDDLANMVMELSERVSEDDFNTIVETFLGSTQIDGKPVEPYLAFAADYGSLFKWLGFCVEHNYSSFLGDLGITNPRT